MNSSDWDCGCSLLGGHICGKQKDLNDMWGSPLKKYTTHTDNTLVKGCKVKCHRLYADKKSTLFDGKIGTLLMFNPNRAELTGRFLVAFDIDSYNYERYCYEISKIEE